MCLSCTSSFALFAVSTWLSAGASKDVSLYQYLTDVSNVDIAELILHLFWHGRGRGGMILISVLL